MEEKNPTPGLQAQAASREPQTADVIDLREVIKSVWNRRRLFYKVWAVTFVLACAYIFPIPRTYTSELLLAPELGGSMTGGSLADLASTFGINMDNIQTSDAFHPELYPEVISTNSFIVGLFDVNVRTIDGEIETDYHTYLTKHQKKTFYKIPYYWAMRQIKSMIGSKSYQAIGSGQDGGSRFNPKMLSEEDTKLVEKVHKLISCSIDKKTYVIKIVVEDQDPLICASMADSVRVRLQDFITAYRTSKARTDMEYYKSLLDDAKREYQQALLAYSAYADKHQNTILQAYLSERDELENNVAMKLNAFTAMNTQYEAAKAKVQERTPAFTMLKAASVPVKPDKPKRMIFVAGMLILVTFGTILYIFKEEVFAQISNLK
jgi:capsular polysaccharide biosynthesis protein